MRRYAELHAGKRGLHCPAGLHQSAKTVSRIDETALAVDRSLPAEAGMRIKDRQQGEADTRLGARCANTFGMFGDIGIKRAVAVVMQIVELADAAETGFEHFHIELRRNRFDLFRRHLQGKTIHQHAPAPKTVVGRSAKFGQAGHGALECVAVKIAHGRDENRMALVGRLGVNADIDIRDNPARDRDAHIGSPSLRQECRACMKRRSSRISHDCRSIVGLSDHGCIFR
ncbi:hypothetical protein D3C80_1393390 [compost metagenome]